jgi:serine/threonine protein kinase
MTSSSHPSHPISQRLTDFTFVDLTVERMGAGGFGLVFMGPDRLNDGQWSALKTLRPELLALRPSLRDLFLSECLTWVGLWPHPNLLTAESATEIDGRLYLILDYAQHGSLRDLLPLDQPFATRLAWAQHIAAGLLALHTPDPEFLRPSPLVHRDLKPENVLVHAQGYAKITDFGLAATLGAALAQSPEGLAALELVEQLAAQAAQSAYTEQTAKSSHASHATRATRATRAPHATRTARFHTRTRGGGASRKGGLGGVGTIQYMPPEQWDTDSEVGPPADLYAFGLILSELLAGRHGLADLESDLDEDGWYQLHLSGVPRPLRSGPAPGASRLPEAVEQLYHALLAQEPHDRPTAEQALAVLQQAATQVGEAPYTPPDVFPRTEEHRMAKWGNWASTCFRFGRYEEALARNDRALALAPHQFELLHTRGAILADLGRQAQQAGHPEEGVRLLEEALGWYDQASAAATSDFERVGALGMKALRLSDLGRYAAAEAAYATALALDPGDGIGWYNRALNGLRWARAEAQSGQRAEALRRYTLAEGYAREAVRLRPNYDRAHRLLATIQQERARLGG